VYINCATAQQSQQAAGHQNSGGAQAPQTSDENKMDRQGREMELQNIFFSFTSKCHGCNEAPANDNNCNVSGWQKLPSTSGR
jgi:hypothetical protein